MAVSTTSIPDRLAETLVIDTSASATAADNVFTGVTLGDKIYSVRLDNSAITSASYFKAQFATTYDVQNQPVIVLYVPASSSVEYVFPEGFPKGGLSTGLSFIGTSTLTQTGTQSNPTGNGSLKVTILAGT
tara:strand:- start:1335 stop:1727 length:393 start_codon:yes stop_codon:yes gene_type:complete